MKRGPLFFLVLILLLIGTQLKAGPPEKINNITNQPEMMKN